LGQRSRKRARQPQARPAPAPTPSPKRAERAEAKNAAAREGLEPLRTGERPTAVTAGAIVLTLLAVGNVAAAAAGLKIRGHTVAFGGVAALSVLLAICAIGMWRARYWGVLGFQALLALTIVYAGLSLAVARSLKGVVICLVIIGPGGYLFWKLVRAMARIQMPERRPRT
jgi:hypothetical protein